MASTYTGTPAFTNSITIPDDGDLAAAATVNNPTRSEADMGLFLLQAIGLAPESTSDIYINSINGTTVNIGPISSIVVNENGNYKFISTVGASVVGVPQVEGGPAQFAANTWYYIYAYSNAGVLNFIIRTVPPDSWKMFALGSDVQRYIGCFKTDGAGPPAIIPFFMTRGKYSYLNVQSVGGGNATVESPITISAYVPPTSRQAVLQYEYTNSALPGSFRLLSRAGTTGFLIPTRVGPATTDSGTLEMAVDDTQSIRYLVSAGTINITINVLGFYE